MYSLKRKLYISQLTENQRNAEQNVGFVYSLYSFLFSLFITYSVGLKRSCFKLYTAADAAPRQCRVCVVLNSCDYFSEFKKFQSEMLGRKEDCDKTWCVLSQSVQSGPGGS